MQIVDFWCYFCYILIVKKWGDIGGVLMGRIKDLNYYQKGIIIVTIRYWRSSVRRIP